MRNLLLFLVIAVIAILNTSVYAEYNLVWSDEFNGKEIDLSNWSHEVGDNWHNNELQAYTDRPENSYVKNGNLVIVARKESYHEKDYTSARMRTMGKRDFLYGKIEARIKFPSGQGMWPAFWMMPTDLEYGEWAASGEIDIVESTNHADHIGGTIHFGGTHPNNAYSSSGSYSGEGVNYAEDFHVYTLEWQPYEMRWYVDNKLYSRKTQWYTTEAPFPAPFDKRFHILLNLAVGGNLPGPPDETTTWPQYLYVDWVRVHQTDNKAPKVTIEFPPDNAVIAADTDIIIKANVTDPDGDVNTVEFYNDYELIGIDSNAPYSLKWAAPDGCYKIYVKATDEDGFSHKAALNLVKGSGCPQQPFHGTPAVIPGKIEAEDFDSGPMNVAYWDTDNFNDGRTEYRKNIAVDIRSFADRYFLSHLWDNEWIEYTVDVTSAGTYDIKVWGGSWRRDGKFHIEFDGVDKTSSITMPSMRRDRSRAGRGRRRRFAQPVTARKIELSAGKQVMRFVVEKGGFNIDYFEILPFDPNDIIDPNTNAEAKPDSPFDNFKQ